MPILPLHKAKTTLSAVVDRIVRTGESVIVSRHGQPVVEIRPVVAKKAPRKGGDWAGRIRISPDFDTPLPDMKEFMD